MGYFQWTSTTPTNPACGNVVNVIKRLVKEYSYRCTFVRKPPTNHIIVAIALLSLKMLVSFEIMSSLISMKSHSNAGSVEDHLLVLLLSIIIFEHIPARSHLNAENAIRHLHNPRNSADISRPWMNATQVQVHRRSEDDLELHISVKNSKIGSQ